MLKSSSLRFGKGIIRLLLEVIFSIAVEWNLIWHITTNVTMFSQFSPTRINITQRQSRCQCHLVCQGRMFYGVTAKKCQNTVAFSKSSWGKPKASTRRWHVITSKHAQIKFEKSPYEHLVAVRRYFLEW